MGSGAVNELQTKHGKIMNKACCNRLVFINRIGTVQHNSTLFEQRKQAICRQSTGNHERISLSMSLS